MTSRRMFLIILFSKGFKIIFSIVLVAGSAIISTIVPFVSPSKTSLLMRCAGSTSCFVFCQISLPAYNMVSSTVTMLPDFYKTLSDLYLSGNLAGRFSKSVTREFSLFGLRYQKKKLDERRRVKVYAE
jgi:hypothetical protein